MDTSEAMQAAAARQIKGANIAWGNGLIYNFDDPNPEIMTLEDLAYALAYTVRWRGQTRQDGRRPFFGVGQHCVFGAQEMLSAGHSRANALGFLFHEPDEVSLPDFPGPAKNSVPGFKAFAKRQGDALLARFGVTIPDPDLCKRWDIRMMVTEKRDLMPGHGRDHFQTSDNRTADDDEFPPFKRRIVPYRHPEAAAIKWLRMVENCGGVRV